MMEDWVEKRIDDVFETVTGNTPSKKDRDNYGSLIPFIKPPQISDNIIDTASEYLSEKGKQKARILPPNSVLVTCIGNLGRIGINKSEIAFNQQINALRPNVFVKPKLMFYQCQSHLFRSQLEKLSTSTTVALVNKGSFNSIQFRLPPLPIQRAIVSKIENLISSLDSGIAELKKAQEQLKIYRQAVLKKAFEGERNVLSIIEVVEKVQIGPFGSQLHKSDYIINGIPLINPMHIKDGKIRPNENYSISIEKRDSLPNYILKENDVIVGRRGEMGRAALVSKKENGWFCGTGSFYLRPKTSMIDPAFLTMYIRSAKVKELLTDDAKGTTMKNLNKKIVSNLSIPVPTIEKQQKIIKQIECRLSVCDKVEDTIKDSLIKAKALRQSILKKAFEGKLLTEAEIEKCKQEEDYEPASVLLERIKKEKK